jgi:glycosyltransferase involved in cell wall biosynthesis
VEGEQKQQLLANARAMIFPIQWEEPFGIAMVEAMVSGTPVIAMSRGAASEIVEPGVTGWLATDVDGMVEAYSRLGEIDLERCVKRSGERFGPSQMADGYESVYERAIDESYYRERG